MHIRIDSESLIDKYNMKCNETYLYPLMLGSKHKMKIICTIKNQNYKNNQDR